MVLDVIFLGGLFQEGQEEAVLSNSIYSFQGAANTLQWAIVEGLDRNLEKPLNIINSMYIGAWPFRYKKLFIRTNVFSHADGSKDVNVGFVNLYGFANVIKKFTLRPYLNKWIQKKTSNQKVIIAYGMNDTILESLKYVKNLDSQVITCLIVPDLPEFMNTSMSADMNERSDKSSTKLYKRLVFVDKFVLLTKHMAEVLKIKDNFVVVEGMVASGSRSLDNSNKQKKVKTIVYTGVLHARYGILILLEAFKRIDFDDYKLIICGFGDSEDKVVEAASNDSRIEFKGLIPKVEIHKVQEEATVLINPRQNNEEFTKYSFPSKNMEYLYSGTPMIAYKLDGIPDEYDDYIYYVSDNNVQTLTDKIIEVCEKQQLELDEFGNRARTFVENEKNNVIQAKKIIEYIKG